MKNRELIPIKKELFFLLKTVFIIIISIGVGTLTLYILLNKETGNTYSSAFKIITEAYNSVNYYIGIAIILQAILSILVVYFIALYFSHKIAGPMFRLKMKIKEYIDGENIDKISFRETDFLPGVSSLFTHFLLHHKNRKQLILDSENLLKQYSRVNELEKPEILKKIKANLIILESDNE